MSFRNKTLITFIVTLYVSLLILGWGALEIIDKQNIERAEHFLKNEAANISFLFAYEEENLDHFENMLQRWWHEHDRLPEFLTEFPFSVKLIPGPGGRDLVQSFGKINWEIKEFKKKKYFSLTMTSILKSRETQQESLLEISRIIFPTWLKSKINLSVLFFDAHGNLQGSAIGNEIAVLDRKDKKGNKQFNLSQEETTRIKQGVIDSPQKIDFMGSQLTLYVPISLQGHVKAIFGLMYPLGRMNIARKSFNFLTISLLSLVTIILTAMYYYSTQRMNRYFDDLFHFTKQLSNGNFSLRLPPSSGEFGQLNNYLNTMTESLETMKKYEQEMIVLDRLESLAQLSTGIAHEIKNPLMVLKYSTGHLKKELTEVSLVEDTDMMDKNILKIEEVVQRLAEFSRPADPEKKEIHNLIEILNETIYFLQKTCENKNITIHSQLASSRIYARIRKNEIYQVFTNVLLNAVEAMPEGGIITITCTIRKEEVKGETAIFSFCDTGSGIDTKNLTRIFNPFFTTKPTGTGLGLAITYKIMVDHGGYIEVDSFQSPTLSEDSEAKSEGPQEGPHLSKSTSGTKVIVGFPIEMNKDRAE